VNLLVTYLVLVTISTVGTAWLGVVVDHMSSPFISLFVFFPLFFGGIWLAWKLAVHLTEPKAKPTG
jgi:hypothetical protein